MPNRDVRPFMEALARANPEPRSELEYADPFTLLVAVVLSAQATDVSVNRATKTLFAEAATPEAIAALGVEGVARHIRSIGLWQGKAKNVVELSRRLVADHGGQVPPSRDALEALPGVGRKTANVVLNVAFGGKHHGSRYAYFSPGQPDRHCARRDAAGRGGCAAEAHTCGSAPTFPPLADPARALRMQSARAGMLAVRRRGLVPVSAESDFATGGLVRRVVHFSLQGKLNDVAHQLVATENIERVF